MSNEPLQLQPPVSVDLKPNSGVWCETRSARIDPSVWIDRSFIEQRPGRGESQRLILKVVRDMSDDQRGLLRLRIPQSLGGYRFTANESVCAFLDRWLPIPYFRRPSPANGQRSDGPVRWARVLLMKEPPAGPGFQDYRVTVAFDTAVATAAGDLSPSDSDVEDASRFAFAWQGSGVEAFVRLPAVEAAIREAFEANRAFSAASSPKRKSRGGELEAIACYLTMLSALDQACVLPEIRFEPLADAAAKPLPAPVVAPAATPATAERPLFATVSGLATARDIAALTQRDGGF